jgi:hypothetical protein
MTTGPSEAIGATGISELCGLEHPVEYEVLTNPDALQVTTKVVGWNVVEV